MSVPALRGRQQAPADPQTLDFERPRFLNGLDAGERIGPPLERPRSSMLSASLVLVVLFGGAWAVLQAPDGSLEMVRQRAAALLTPVRDYRAATAMPTPEAPRVAEAPAHADEPLPPVEAPPTASGGTDAALPPDSVPVETGALGGASETAEPAEAQPLPPMRIDPADPYQRRAVAVGLHPDLSRVLLARLTSADYRNAGYAVDTAVAKTADEGSFVWPRQRKPEQALFRVHFVPGAAHGCRRYVVTVVKDGWTTTALPMERCGSVKVQG